MTEPNLRFRAVFCENLRFSEKICSLKFLRPPNAWTSRRKGESAKICGPYPKDPAVLKYNGIVNYYAAMFLQPPQICYAVNPSLRGKMPTKLRKIVSAPGGCHSKSLCVSKFTTHSKFSSDSAKWWFSLRMIRFFWGGPGILDLVTELCPPQNTA